MGFSDPAAFAEGPVVFTFVVLCFREMRLTGKIKGIGEGRKQQAQSSGLVALQLLCRLECMVSFSFAERLQIVQMN